MAARTDEHKDEPVNFLLGRAGMTRRGFVEWARRHSVGVLLHQSQARNVRVTDKLQQDLQNLYAEKGIDMQATLAEKYGTDDLDTAYQQYRFQRQEMAELPEKFSTESRGQSPIVRLAHTVGSVSALSRLLCVPESTVRFFAQGKTKSVPDEIVEAMRRSGWPKTDAFIAETEKWNASAGS